MMDVNMYYNYYGLRVTKSGTSLHKKKKRKERCNHEISAECF